MTFVGLDLHKRYITACAIDVDGMPRGDIRRLSVALDGVLQFLADLPQPVSVALEATLYWSWLHDHLVRTGYRVQVAHAFQAKLIWQARSKTDPIAARKLAELLRANLHPAIWVPDVQTRALRQLLRSRAFLVRQRTQVTNRIHGHLTSENQLFGQTDLYGRAGRAWLEQVARSPVLHTEVLRLLRLHDVLTTEIHALMVRPRAPRDTTRPPSNCTRFLAWGCSARCFSSPRSAPSTASARATSSRHTLAWCPARGVPAARPRMGAWATRATGGSRGS